MKKSKVKKSFNKLIFMVLLILLILLICLVVHKYAKDENETVNDTSEVLETENINKEIYDISEVFEIENIEESNLGINNNVSNRVSIDLESLSEKDDNKEIIELEGKVKLDDMEGIVLYARSEDFKEKANIFQVEYPVEKTEDLVGIIREFTIGSFSYLEIPQGIPTKKHIIESDNSNNEANSIEEAIYLYNCTYKVTFDTEEGVETISDNSNDITNSKNFSNYKMYFYMNGENLVCEFVRIF